MKITPIGLAVALLASSPLAVAAQTQLTDQQANQIVEKSIEALNKAFRNRDAAAAATIYAEDATRITTEGTVHGRAAITRGYAAMLGNKDWHEDPDQIDQVRVISKNVILATGTWSGTLKHRIRMHGFWESVVVRRGDTWKTVMGMINLASDH